MDLCANQINYGPINKDLKPKTDYREPIDFCLNHCWNCCQLFFVSYNLAGSSCKLMLGFDVETFKCMNVDYKSECKTLHALVVETGLILIKMSSIGAVSLYCYQTMNQQTYENNRKCININISISKTILYE